MKRALASITDYFFKKATNAGEDDSSSASTLTVDTNTNKATESHVKHSDKRKKDTL